MAKVLEITKEYDIGLYDSATGESLKTEKAVDITEDCPKASERERVILLFTTAKRGRIVQIGRPYPGEVYMGAHIHFFVDELKRLVAERNDTFSREARIVGLTKAALLNLVKEHAPELETTHTPP